VTIAVALAFYIGVASVLFFGLNSVRLQDYRDSLAQPLVSWIRQAPAQHMSFLRSVIDVPDAAEVVESDTLVLSRLEHERLAFGQVLGQAGGDDALYVAAIDTKHLLKIHWQNPTLQGPLWNAWVIAGELAVLNEVAAFERLQYWQALTHLSLSLESVDTFPRSLSHLLERFEQQGYLLLGNASGENAELWVPAGDDRLLRVADLPNFDPWALSVLTAIVFTGLAIIAVALYFSLEGLDRRLRKLETVATRIARGELDARVDDNRFDAVGKLAQVFNRMADHIQRLVAVQREMIHAVSHELRTPVARIRFGVQMIEDCTDEAMRQKQINGIDSDIQELNELIDEILTYARLEQGGPVLDFQEANLLDIARQVVSEQKILKPEIQVEAQILGESEKWGTSQVEPRYIHRSLQNLVGNAIRYASQKVVVKCNFGEETCRIDVEDDGPGIPESDWEKVFTPFARLDDSRTRSSGGYGLGLSIVRRILYWHGGQAFVTRSSMGGAKFSLVWPRNQAKEA
jgi:two-component system sensor histidine kinase RstB